MAYLIGAGVAAAVALFALLSGFDRDKAFYPTVLIVTASYYCLFAVMAGSGPVLVYELVGLAAFATVAVIGFKRGLGFVAAGLIAHALFDVLREGVIVNDGVPAWWPGFCIGFDVAAGAWLAWRFAGPGARRREAPADR